MHFCQLQKLIYPTCTIISRGLYIFCPKFHCSLYNRVVSTIDNLCNRQENSSIFEPKIRGLQSRVVIIGSVHNTAFFSDFLLYLKLRFVSNTFWTKVQKKQPWCAVKKTSIDTCEHYIQSSLALATSRYILLSTHQREQPVMEFPAFGI